MIALEVTLNGKRICVAGAEDLSVLSTDVTCCGRLGKRTVPGRPRETVDLFYFVSGLTSRPDPDTDVHMNWKSVAPLRLGDVVQVRILEVEKADPPKSRRRAQRKPAKTTSTTKKKTPTKPARRRGK